MIAGESSSPLDDHADPDAVVVASGKQSGSGRRTERGRMKIAVAESLAGQGIDIRGSDTPA